MCLLGKIQQIVVGVGPAREHVRAMVLVATIPLESHVETEGLVMDQDNVKNLVLLNINVVDLIPHVLGKA